MSYMWVTGPCAACGRLFDFNADKVPSVRVNGKREPVCEDCMTTVNAKRQAMGLEPFPILPGAYEPEEVGI